MPSIEQAHPHAHAGTKPVVVCLHCSASSGRQWQPFAERLAPGAQVLAPNLLGYGSEAAWPLATGSSLEDEAAALSALLAEQHDGVHLVGHSYGAAVALEAALRWPRLVRSLTLYEPVRFALLRGLPSRRSEASGRSEGPEAAPTLWERIVGVGRRIGARVLAGDVEGAAALFVDYWSGDGTWAALPARHREAVSLRMPKVRAEFEALFNDAVPLAAYRRLRAPVHFLVGGVSPEPAREVSRRLAAAIPNVRWTLLPALGHMGPVTHPEAVFAAMRPFLEHVLSGRPTRVAA